MTPPPNRQPSSPFRRASIVLLVLGALAGLLGVVMIAAAPQLAATAAPTPQLQERMDEIRRELPFSIQTLFVVAGVLTLVYATVALTLGVLVRSGGRATAIVTLVLAGVVAAITALQAGVYLMLGGAADAVLSLLITAAHGVVVKWMIQTLRRPAAAPLRGFEPIRKPPLADYYLPPAPPA